MTELRRQAKAAAALRGMDLKDLAAEMNYTVSTFNRRLDNEHWRPHARKAFIQELADATKLRVEFFAQDFGLSEPGADADLRETDDQLGDQESETDDEDEEQPGNQAN